MDPVGPWSAYASYNRLAGVQPPGSSASELHHHIPTGGATSATAATTTSAAAQLLPSSFLSPTTVGYETVFSPLFHHAAGAKPPAHYVAQHRALAAQAAATKPATDNEYHQAQAFFEQNASAWQQNSPFGILPHESVVVPTTAGKTTYENFNAHFAATQSLNHLNSQLAAVKNAAVVRAQSPAAQSAATSKTSPSFFQTSTSFASAANTSCIVTSPANIITPSVSKEYRVPTQTRYLASPNPTRTLNKNQQAQIQTKAQTKIYPELANQQRENQQQQRNNEEPQSQSSPISFSIMDVPGRLNYSGSNASSKRAQQQFHANYRHYQNSEEFQRPKSGSSSDYSSNSNTNAPDCNVVVPRRPSPLQAHSQASPLGHAASPAYPMYNSPMNSISSPQHTANQQVTPPSPLDVTVPRPAATTVAYPSVITRALNSAAEESAYANNCNWEDRQNHRNKFNNTASSNYNSGAIKVPRHLEQQQQQQRSGSNMMPESRTTAQNYFDTNSSAGQVPLQDLSSCRGDPMSIVKNLQQQNCQVGPIEPVKADVKPPPVKRRKSGDKSLEVGRIPPPAHSTPQQPPPPQQQNGATPYFEFDRWNLPPPPPTAKLFPQTIHHHQQQLMVPHHHHAPPPPTLPYFPPFHLPPHHHPGEYPSGIDLPTLTSSYQEQNTQHQQPATTSYHHQPPEEHPKVVVPNIEEELNFLSAGNAAPARAIANRAMKIPEKPPAANNSGFMSSYLKFLQGERDSSPPPATRTTRKHSWTRTKPPVLAEEKRAETNGVGTLPMPVVPPPQQVAPPPAPLPPVVTKHSSLGDPQDDPRYFPLPKERKRNSFDSDSDGFASEDDFFNNRKFPVAEPAMEKGKKKQQRKSVPVERKQKPVKKHSKGSREEDAVPRRESSKRAAKDKTVNHFTKNADDDLEEPAEFQDSDSDPAWTPRAKEDGDEILPISARQKGRKPTKRRKNLISAAAQSAGIPHNDSYGNEKKRGKSKPGAVPPPTLEDNIAASLSNNSALANDNPFKPGEFVVIRSELSQEWPSIWRVDGKTLLQKYEPFDQNGVTLYRNISTYTSWTSESRKQYVSIPVRYKSQSQMETVVQFMRSEMTLLDTDFQERCMKECECYQDNFEVYIQTLISQALDSNFLTEIFQEKDEYFLSNVKTIDDITDSKKKKLLTLLRWPPPVQAAVCTWPCYNIIRELSGADAQLKNCAACGKYEVSVRVLMYGQPYNSTTLEGCQPDPKAMNEKNFLMCRLCATRVELANKVTHQKYLMYIECAKRVAEKRTGDLNKDTTCILNELLADENWLNQLFYAVRTTWAEIDCLEHSFCLKNSMFMQ